MSILPRSKIRVAVLRGGPSSEYEASLKSGEHVLAQLRNMNEKYDPVDILISRDGSWYYQGIKHEPHEALRHADVAWNALHGKYGEDGKVQQILSILRLPYTGSSSVPAALSLNKEHTKRAYVLHSLLTPRWEVLEKDAFSQDQLINIFQNFLHPVIIKPSNSGSWNGVNIAYTFQELVECVNEAFLHSDKVLVEEFIKGKEASCGVVEKLRGQELYALVPIEIKAKENILKEEFQSKLHDREHVSPGNFTSDEKKRIEYMAKKAHEVLGLRHYSHSDFILTPKGRIYILETNSLPKISENSIFPSAFKTVGWNTEEFVDHVINLALQGGNYN